MARRTRMPVPIRIAIFLMVVIVCYVCYKIIHFINVNSDSVSIKRVYDGQSRSDILPVSPNDKQNRGDMYVVDENYKYMENEKLHRLDSQSQDVTADNKESFTDSDSDQYSDVDSKDPQRLRYISTVPESPFEVQKCPVCFGSSLCHRIGSGDAKFDLSVKQTSTNQKLYPGLYKHVKVTGKRLGTNAEFQKLDNFICVNTSQEVNCDVGDAVVMTYLASDEAFTVPHFRNELWKVAHTSKADLSATVCATDRFIDELKELYNKDRKGILNEEERARLMTSLILNPEGLLLKFFLETGYEEDIAWPFPQYIGECGRVVITEHAGKPLVQFLNASWEQRVALSLQLFDMVDTFLKGSSDWLVLFGDFRFSNFAVTDTGRVVVTNLKDILIVDKQETLKGKLIFVYLQKLVNHT
uniref:Deleted in autism protein 1 homolog n=1 Tax=Saccoglossus kowalevskii TaxID=10224 RepID=A0ABM0MIV3_SACKO|nr:PREDICTED: deleted in autism protein 1 homolog [Saccoglossus kowalevskii]